MGAVYTWEGAEDPAYPGETPPDSAFPRQTAVPLCPVFEGVVVPSVWSRLRSPMERCMREMWRVLRVTPRVCPSHFIGLRSGRLVVNAHGWEQLCAAVQGREAESFSVRKRTSLWEDCLRPLERMRMRRAQRSLPGRVQRALERADSGLAHAESIDLAQLDTPRLARGPLDEWHWAEILLPWFVARAARPAAVPPDSDPGVRSIDRALSLEQRFAGELGRRLVNAGVLHKRGDIAYLTVEERIQAVIDLSAVWTRLVDQRVRRVCEYAELSGPEDRSGRSEGAPGAIGGSGCNGGEHVRA